MLSGFLNFDLHFYLMGSYYGYHLFHQVVNQQCDRHLVSLKLNFLHTHSCIFLKRMCYHVLESFLLYQLQITLYILHQLLLVALVSNPLYMIALHHMCRHHFLSAYNSNYEPKLHFRQHDKYGNPLPQNYKPLIFSPFNIIWHFTFIKKFFGCLESFIY